MSLVTLAQTYGSDEEGEEKWDGTIPDDADKWCSALHLLISDLLGYDGCESGVDLYCDHVGPLFYCMNDGEFIEFEE